ncbi:MAG: 3-phosphoshikimate 1-carboxyvinyltransferase [Tannerella sp.]|jgi:3-phosphoshikimate 1-carboxyvinyltransferase|nr:3-phosphoshikimate 1-carboxyvinyltransferase [Tannerella sp.]
MNYYAINAPPAGLKAVIALPASKSISNRVLVLNALSPCPQEIRNLSDCDDTEVMLHALRSGAAEVDIRAAGTAMRFLTACLAGKTGTWTITGTERMKNRPVKILVDALRSLGAKISFPEKDGFPPLRVEGRPLQGGEVTIEGGVSSQYISALLMVAPVMKNGLCLHLTGETVSKPYLRLTVGLMRQFGVTVAVNGRTLTVAPQTYAAVPLTVESDWSAASYWYEMAALSGQAEVRLTGLFRDSLQGDAAIVPLFERLGVETRFLPDGAALKRVAPPACRRLELDLTDMPDMAQTLTATCAALDMPFRFDGLQSLKIKETDRLEALRTELRKFGYPLNGRDGRTLEWNGERCRADASPVIHTYEDHRMAMALAPLALARPEGVRVACPEVVSKSYPHFWDDLRSAGFSVAAGHTETVNG